MVDDNSLIPATDAARGSFLESLHQQIEDREEAMHLDLKVPGLKRIKVRYGLVDFDATLDLVRKAEKTMDPRVIANANISILIGACQGVFEVDPDTGEPFGDPTQWPRFDERLGALLVGPDEEPLTRAAEVCRRLYAGADMVIANISDQVMNWSRTLGDDLDEELAGN